ncbi:MAG TPA: DUF2339 domain-containing protein [Leptospiraceae bacterium]|nr:DUF2339 domain-containing protein [Leptospiraceae bacterium]HNI97307.1 DUF2339 domain-containing protein [Leptospiraceae bacterium]HNN05578.1 DUF2339 domain-containing protein [Leptospiraceae bacterium]
MVEFFLFVSYIVLIVLWRRNSALKEDLHKSNLRMASMEKKLNDLQSLPVHSAEIYVQEKPAEISKPLTESEEKKEEIPSAAYTAKEEKITLDSTVISDEKMEIRASEEIQDAVTEKKERSWWQKTEKSLLENWTGILGAVILVLGVGFLAAVAFIIVPPFVRFLIISGFAGSVYWISGYIKRKDESWEKLSDILFSTSAVIFLIACIGSYGISGIKFIEDPLFSIPFILLGLGVNLYAGYSRNKETYASLHIALTFIGLASAPQNLVILFIASAVTLLAVRKNYAVRWDWHLFLTAFSYFCFHIYNYSERESAVKSDAFLRISGIILVSSVYINALYVHYIEAFYSEEKLPRTALLTHISSWIFLGISLLAYSTGSQWTPIYILAVGAGAFVLSQTAKRRNIRWLYVCDMWAAEALILIGIFGLEKWDIPIFVLILLSGVQAMIFALWNIHEKSPILAGSSVLLLSVFQGTMAVIVILNQERAANLDFRDILNLSAFTVFVFLEGIYYHYSKKIGTDFLNENRILYWISEIPGFIFAVSFLSLYAYIDRQIYAPAAFAALICGIGFYRNRIQSPGIGAGLLFLFIISLTDSWNDMKSFGSEKPLDFLSETAPHFFSIFFLMKFSYIREFDRKFSIPFLYIFNTHLLLSIHFFTAGVSPFLTGVSALLISLILTEFSENSSLTGFIEDSGSSKHLIINSLIFSAVFLYRHLLIHLQSGAYLWIFPVRFWIEIFALSAFIFILFRKSSIYSFYNENIQPFFAELSLLFFVLAGLTVLPEHWSPPYWAALALVCYLISNVKIMDLSRFAQYSLIIQAVNCFYIAFISSSEDNPGGLWQNSKWIPALAAIALTFPYLYLLYGSFRQKEIKYPGYLSKADRVSVLAQNRVFSLAFYPFFAAVFLFLYWSASGAILTLLWVVFAFAVFAFSLLVKEQHFRYASLGILFFCIFRLIFHDLSSTGALTRAFVFVGTGIILLIMNSLYNKYKDRLE